ncbi:DUF2336 domain-containing protein [Roseibium sp. MMSF_3544]|uniref:DUF2336 domain-containing protein n=1 Tax=unclassified Roseibium TaxID=2629323 RepID=UPI00273D7C91|nr:DUF2336 domain-containing protein [Roseibium sp. MMSF_3544]
MRQSQRFNPNEPPSKKVSSTRPTAAPARQVLLPATEFFVGRQPHDIEEKRIFLELARNLLPSTPVEDRRRISSLLAGHPEIPDDLQERLARDEDPETAAPALRKSPRLSVDLLASIAQNGPEISRQAIATRPSLRESIISVLCDHAEASVIAILLERDDITLSKTHQAKLCRRSEIIATLGLELAGQDALNPDGLMGQFLHLPAPLKKQAIAAAEMTSLVKQAQTPGGNMSQRPDKNRLRIQEALVQEALNQNRSRFADLLGQGLGLSRSTCDLLLRSDQGEGLTIALKALGLPEFQTTTILVRLLGDETQLSDLRGLLRMHRTLTHGAAEALVSQWLLHDQGVQKTNAHYSSQYQEAGGRKASAKPVFGRSKNADKKIRFTNSAEN